ncbi:hypothetical protein HNQ88_004545 [Aureibacter tunicatorum]|uniref:Uncharacterized protein n=1 Tax=Aureibacter tunicatorum TaxID=866807 RepID=A0AAE3XRK7_9BACT|nr:hypothetical protein [Aureibacter tunicatorum]BDD06697.1 hypothetical protein AUTU_41800 [Aureibacter tunicatorum]
MDNFSAVQAPKVTHIPIAQYNSWFKFSKILGMKNQLRMFNSWSSKARVLYNGVNNGKGFRQTPSSGDRTDSS